MPVQNATANGILLGLALSWADSISLAFAQSLSATSGVPAGLHIYLRRINQPRVSAFLSMNLVR